MGNSRRPYFVWRLRLSDCRNLFPVFFFLGVVAAKGYIRIQHCFLPLYIFKHDGWKRYSGSPGDFGYGTQPGFYDFFPGQPPPDGMAYHGVLGPGQNVPPPPTSMEQPLSAVVGPGPVNLGADAPYLTNHGDHLLSQRSSPDSVLSLASDAYGPPRSSSAGFPGAHPMSETPVW
ncbi:hypothetical protein CDAR_77851 [Caerostris darwini]|uniref:Uncharacterized protein n=1 Tax=Caerostris darwini TaxID=1538125 RepID=A0AAV4NDA8_9ARAC|nr:hypothetical protein CDAR_77851 [Caerostris darwini]